MINLSNGNGSGNNTIMAIIPVVVFYLSAQKYIIKGVAAGAVKG